MKKVNGKSLNPQEELIKQLKKNFPEVFSEDGKVDPEKLKLTLGEDIELSREKYGLSWAGKSDCFREIQKTTTATLVPQKNESVNFDETENIFIEGENLETLRVLQKPYYGKVKMIYIDPPYNTGNDFVYNDSFKQNKKEYQEQIGETNGNGDLSKDTALRRNTRDNGHYHSDWLNMMYPRLFLARNLLRRDGVIFVSIDDNEVQNLRMIMNEIFGEENFVAMFVHKNNSVKNQAKLVSISTEYVLCYAKDLNVLKNTEWRIKKKGAEDIAKLFKRLQDQGLSLDEIEVEIKEMYKRPKYSHLSRWNKVDKHGVFKDSDLSREGGSRDYTIVNPNTGKECKIPTRGWGKSLEELKRLQKEDLIWYGDDGTPPGMKDYINIDDNRVPDNFWYFDNSVDTRWIKEVYGNLVFENPKPVEMMKQMIETSCDSDSLILDFFAGSATTAHAVMDLNKEDGGNRKYIMVQLPEKTDEDSEAYKAGYKNIAEIAKERIRRAGNKLTDGGKQLDLGKDGNKKLDIGFKAFKLSSSNFKEWNTEIKTEEELQQQLEAFVSNGIGDVTDMAQIYELLLKNGYDLNSKVEAKEIKDKKVYLVNGGELVICLEGVLERDIVDEIVKLEPAKVIFLEICFNNDDELKTNTLLQMESADIDFRVV